MTKRKSSQRRAPRKKVKTDDVAFRKCEAVLKQDGFLTTNNPRDQQIMIFWMRLWVIGFCPAICGQELLPAHSLRTFMCGKYEQTQRCCFS